MYDGNLTDLLHAHSQSRLVHLDLAAPLTLNLPEEQVLSRTPEHAELKLPAAEAPAVLSAIFAAGVVRDIRVEDEDVTELVERLYQEGSAGA